MANFQSCCPPQAVLMLVGEWCSQPKLKRECIHKIHPDTTCISLLENGGLIEPLVGQPRHPQLIGPTMPIQLGAVTMQGISQEDGPLLAQIISPVTSLFSSRLRPPIPAGSSPPPTVDRL